MKQRALGRTLEGAHEPVKISSPLSVSVPDVVFSSDIITNTRLQPTHGNTPHCKLWPPCVMTDACQSCAGEEEFRDGTVVLED